MTSNKSKTFKVTGSYTIQTFYSKEFEVEDDGLDPGELTELVRIMALDDEFEGLEGWREEWSKVIGDEFYIERIELLTN